MTQMLDTNTVEEQDILENFRTAVRNGQTRLALEALVDVIDAIVEIITPSEDTTEKPQQTAQPVENKVDEEKPTTKKRIKESQSATETVE
jgi:hypothetical protein